MTVVAALAATALTSVCLLLVAVVLAVSACRVRFRRIRSRNHDYYDDASVWQSSGGRGGGEGTGADDTGKGERTRESSAASSGTKTIGFFHPNCAAGGGGERVLWSAVEVLGHLNDDRGDGGDDSGGTKEAEALGLSAVAGAVPRLRVAVYTTDAWTQHYHRDVLEHVRTRFGIVIPSSLPLSFVHVDKEGETPSEGTDGSDGAPPPPRKQSLAAQSFSSMRLSWRALTKLTPDIYFDTTGCAFTFVVARILAGCTVAAYVHYPTISTDMLALVWERRPTYNNDDTIAASAVATYSKLVYYLAFAACYGAVGSLSSLVMVNSSWTYAHIRRLWMGCALMSRIRVVYPPCDTESLADLPLSGREDGVILSIGQFRPEKDHALQLRAFAAFLARGTTTEGEGRRGDSLVDGATLVLLGSCRDVDDEARVEELRKLAGELGIQDHVKFVLNQPYGVLREWLGRASVGIHTMWNEHFGIGVVEMMSAGLITIAHDSGGPKADIVVPMRNGQVTGFLASTVDEYADVIGRAFRLGARGNDAGVAIRRAARESAKRFSSRVFEDSFKAAVLSSNILN